MEEYAECKVCNAGALLPFFSPEGQVVYFCTNCLTRFSGYIEDPAVDGEPVFAECAYYSLERQIERVEPINPGKLMDLYRDILEDHPPKPVNGMPGSCPSCQRPIDDDGICMDLCCLQDV